MSGGVLFLDVDAKSVERNEVDESFSAACQNGNFSASLLKSGSINSIPNPGFSAR